MAVNGYPTLTDVQNAGAIRTSDLGFWLNQRQLGIALALRPGVRIHHRRPCGVARQSEVQFGPFRFLSHNDALRRSPHRSAIIAHYDLFCAVEAYLVLRGKK